MDFHSLIFIRQIAPIHLCAANDYCDLLEILIKNNADVRLNLFFRHEDETILYRLISSMVKDKQHYIMRRKEDLSMLVDV